MLGAPGIPNNPPAEVRGIPVGRMADALFFLHTARIDKKMPPREIAAGKNFEMFRYVVHHKDGRDEIVTIFGEADIGDYKVKDAAALPGAQLAWTKPYADTGFSAAVYSKQWDNPRPDVEISSIDVVYGPHKRGVPAVLAITSGVTAKTK